MKKIQSTGNMQPPTWTQQPPPPHSPALPPGWITANDPVSGRIYYANASTGQTSWDPPPPPVVLPPPTIPTTTTASVVTNNNSNMLVPTVTRMMTMEQQEPNKVELPNLSGGMIADLIHIQQTNSQNNNNQDISTNNPYDNPIHIPTLPITAQPPHIEPGRVEIRMHALFRQLQNI